MYSFATKGLTLHSHTGVAYRFDPGALCLELLTTGGPGPYHRYEVLHEPADLTVWDFISSPEGIALWLGPGTVLAPEHDTPYRTAEGVAGEVRGYRPSDRIRVTYGTTTVQVALAPAADGARTVLRLHQEHLASAEERERQRAYWQDVMDQVSTAPDRH
ncbi:hypothetical protein ABWJ92_37715 [Streptomyces sp. NPDC000609]|uniref:SRPBCC family protein n=1 Tax=Streptomyces sp. NPDC000609 TaxID=3160957 RepID=UPI003399699D